jgi:hypothetical protein
MTTAIKNGGSIFMPTRPLIQEMAQQILGGKVTSGATAGKMVPGYPGQKLGLSMEQVQAFIQGSRKVKGFIINLAAGVPNPVNIDISGNAKLLLGFVLFPRTQFADPTLQPRAISLMINDEQAINTMPFSLINKQNSTDNDYFEFIRPVAGNDSITLTIDNTGAGVQTIDAAFYYL